MKAAFFHDTILYIDTSEKNNKYYSIVCPYGLWKRYLKYFNKLIVVTRSRDISTVDVSQRSKLNVSSGEGVEFQPVKGYKTPMQTMTVHKQVKRVLSSVDCAIIRLPSVIGLIACHQAIKMRVPFAIEVVGCAWDALWNHGTIQAKLLALPMFLLNRYYISKSSHAIYVTNEFLQKRYPSNGVVIGCSDVEIGELLDPNVLDSRLKKIEAGFSEREVVFGLVGSLDVNYKGHKTAMQALAVLKDELNFRLRLLGKGNKQRWEVLAEQLGIADKVEFCGTLPSGQAVFNWMDNLDIFLIPSLQEGLPRALVEAMSRGLPAIGANTGGIPELIRSDFLHNPKNYKELANLIKKLLKNKQLMLEISKYNFEKAKRFTKNELESRRNEFYSNFYYYVLDKQNKKAIN